MATARRRSGEATGESAATRSKRRAHPEAPAAPDTTSPAERDALADTQEDTAPQHGELLRRARDVLAEADEPLPADELAAAVFGFSGFSGGMRLPGGVNPWAPMLERLLRPSPLFACDDEGYWRLTAWDVARQSLTEVEFVVLDVETTGLAPGRHRIIEVGAVIVRGGEQIAVFRKLINPQRHIPQFITQFTGINERMVARAAPASAVLPKLREFIGARPLVGHNVGFDLGFLAYEADRCGMSGAFPLDGIDTIGLARRYLTGMRRAKLDYVAAALHIPVHTRHRALPDAELTARIFAQLLAKAREAGCETLDDLRRGLAGLAPLNASSSGLPQPRPTGSMYLNPAWRREFPTTPGVYLMKDSAGTVIYVGKAKCLRDRLASYYNQPLGYTRKMDGLLQNVREIETRQLGSELEALLVESRLIKALQPQYNVQLRNHERYPFIKLDRASSYPRFLATRDVAADGAQYFGPFRSNHIVQTTIELINKAFPLRTCTRNLPPDAKPSEPCLRYHLKRCPAPCRGALPDTATIAYTQALDEACAFLGGERDDLLDRLKREMFAASARQDYEHAARLRDALRDADQVLLGQRLVTGAVEANNLLIVYPSIEADHQELYLIRHGRLIRQERALRTTEALSAAAAALATHAVALGTPPACVGREEVDQINIIARWIHHHSEDDERAFFRLPRDLSDTAGIDAFAAHVAETVLAGATSVERDGDAEDE